jgi:hypothetical protein
MGKPLTGVDDMYNPQVHVHKTVLMQRLLDSVSRGYCWHTSGSVPLNKAQRLSNKFAERYGVHRNANRRAYAKRKGQANTRLFLWHKESSTHLLWWLLVTEGEGTVHDEEQLYDASNRRHRIRIDDDYELIRRVRPSNKGGGEVWTWRMTHLCIEQWEARLLNASRSHNPTVMTQTLGSLYRTPGFSGVRHQVGKLVQQARKLWMRHHASLDAFQLPPRLPYVERIKDTSVSLSRLSNNQ